MKAQIHELVTMVAKHSIWANERMIEQTIDALRISIRPPNRAVFSSQLRICRPSAEAQNRGSNSKELNIA
jgi:hypothetical protein